MARVIPTDVMIAAVNATLQRWPDRCTDKWWEEQAAFCRAQCGVQYAHVETDWIRDRATSLRKAGKLSSVAGGPTRKKLTPPQGRYADYLESEHWSSFRVRVLDFWERWCCLCKEPANDVHHNTYARVGHERLSDCVALCKVCHKRFHGRLPDGNQHFNDTVSNGDDNGHGASLFSA